MRWSGNLITVKAPAKINLTLEVLGKRPDGYHEIRSIFQAIAFYDTLTFNSTPGVSISCDLPEWSAAKSLVSKAAVLLQQYSHVKKGAAIRIDKQILVSSGLGGDSSDAAAALRGLNQLWKLDLSTDKLLALASQLGSDVPFFLHGGTAFASGRGEVLESLPSFPRMWVLLVIPDIPAVPRKTTRMYAALKPSHFTDGSITQNLAVSLKKGINFDPSLLFNTFENIAFEIYSRLAAYKEHLLKLGASRVHLAGSGPTLYTVFPHRAPAQDFYQRCQEQGMKINLAETI
jgi:4-diphosphocytidyl-2-C-methyl-D-erythritol kinase